MPKGGSRAAAEYTEPDYAVWKDKEPTDLQARFVPWIIDKVGVEFGTKKEQLAFAEGVRLAVSLRMRFQASPENQATYADTSDDAKAAAAAAKPPAKTAKAAAAKAAPAKAAKANGRRAAAKAAPEPETAEADEVVTEPAQTTRRQPRRRPAQKSTGNQEMAPF